MLEVPIMIYDWLILELIPGWQFCFRRVWKIDECCHRRRTKRLEIIARNPYHVFLQNWRECIDSSTFQRPTDLVFQKTKYEVCCFYFFSLHKTIFGREAGAFIRKINVWTILFLALQKCCNVLQYCRVFRLQFLKGLLYHNVLFIVSHFILHKSIEPNSIKFVSPAPCLHWQEFSASYAFKFSPLRSSYRIPSRYSSPVLKSGNILSPFPLLIIIKSPLIRDLKYVATFHFRKRKPIL